MAGSGHLSTGGRASCGPSAQLGECRAAASSQGWEGMTPGEKGQGLFPGPLLQPVLRGGRNARRISKQAQGRRREEQPCPRPACRARLAPRPLVPEGPPRPVCPSVPQRQQSRVTAREHRDADASGARASLKPGSEVSKVQPWGRAGGCPWQMGPNTGLEAPAWGRRKGQRGELLPESCGVLGGQGRRAQFCWWGAWAPWVLRADEGLGRERAPVPEGAGFQGWGGVWCLAAGAVDESGPGPSTA